MNDARSYLKQNILQTLGAKYKKAKAGDVGIEIECEGHNFNPGGDGVFWKGVADGSLRGESMEYVLVAPILYADVKKALSSLKRVFADNGTILNQSYRTSVHVHMNFSKNTVIETVNFITMYYIFEELLFDIAGSERSGNLFCLKASDAEYIVNYIKDILKGARAWHDLSSDYIRYAAMNLKALCDHGSIEFRGFRGTDDFDSIEEWVQILKEIKDFSLKYKNPQEICLEFSRKSPIGFVNECFSAPIARKISALPGMYERLYEGVRVAQDIAYCLPDWVPNEKPNPVDDGWVVPKMKIQMAGDIQRVAPPVHDFDDDDDFDDQPIHNLDDDDEDEDF